MYLGQVAAKQDQSAQAENYFNQAAEEPLLAQEAKIQASLALSKQDKYSDAQRALQEAISLTRLLGKPGLPSVIVMPSIVALKKSVLSMPDLAPALIMTPMSRSIRRHDTAANVIAPLGRDAVFTQYGNFEYEFFPTGPYGLMASYNLFMTWHPRLTLYDVMSHTFGVTPSYRTPKGYSVAAVSLQLYRSRFR